MSATINPRALINFATGFLVAVMTLLIFQAITADAVETGEATFVPVTPCRLFDTRADSLIGTRSTPLGANERHDFQVTGTNGNCVIPTAATAVAINLTGVAPSADTYLRIFPADTTMPNVSALNMTAGDDPAPNKLDVGLSIDGKVAVFNRFGSVHVIGDVMGYYRHDGLADLDARTAELDARIAELETLTASMTSEVIGGEPTVRFTDVNVQIVDGSGDTGGGPNGRGNLIVGYNETGPGMSRNGSHNLVIGPYHSYSQYGGLVSGTSNTISGRFASVTGGSGNTASGSSSAVTGGSGNTASGTSSAVTGGNGNTASFSSTSVSGGVDNTAGGPLADGFGASVSGGNNNFANGGSASICGGKGNFATGSYASVSGGEGNSAEGFASSVSGGASRTAPGLHDWVAGLLFETD